MNRTLTFGLALIAVLTSTAAHANMGVPMIAVAMPAFVIALIPIILIEAYVFHRAGFAFGWALQWNAIANAVTTLIGVPATWFALLGLNIVTVGTGCGEATDTTTARLLWTAIRAPWLCPSADGAAWTVSLAFLLLLIPFFFMSWLIEAFIIRVGNKALDGASIRRTSLQANIITYALMALYGLAINFIPN